MHLAPDTIAALERAGLTVRTDYAMTAFSREVGGERLDVATRWSNGYWEAPADNKIDADMYALGLVARDLAAEGK